jgi:hypothetical protein
MIAVKKWMWVLLSISVFCNGASLWLYAVAVTGLKDRVTQLEEIAGYHSKAVNGLVNEYYERKGWLTPADTEESVRPSLAPKSD